MPMNLCRLMVENTDFRFEKIRIAKRNTGAPNKESGNSDLSQYGYTVHTATGITWTKYNEEAKASGLTDREIYLIKLKHGKYGKPAKSINVERSLTIKSDMAMGKTRYEIILEHGRKKGYSVRSIAATYAALLQAKKERVDL